MAESESYAILLYKLRKLGIFRNLTENDYGIDFEVELVSGSSITGRFFKAQVKSAENLKIRLDRVPTVGGIKQSTLRYWCELSYHTHVLAYAVDLASEKIYVSRPLFWQATQLLDESDSSKTIEFLPESEEIDQDQAVALLSIIGASSPSMADTIYALTTAMRYLRQFLELRFEAGHYDAWVALDNAHLFRSFLEVSSILLAGQEKGIPLSDDEKANMNSFDYWAGRGDAAPDVLWGIAKVPLNAIMPSLVTVLQTYRVQVSRGAYYWRTKNPQFLHLMMSSPLPAVVDARTLDDWGEKYDEVARVRPFKKA